jgi:hypothetical protein
MALFDTNSGLGNLLSGMNIFGSNIPTGILDPTQEEKLRTQALISGGIGTIANYLATPKNLNTGSALPYLAKAYLGGMGSSQNTVDTALNNVYRQQLLAGKNDPFGTIDISKFTPESIAAFQQTKDYSKLVPVSTQRGTNIGNIDPTKFTTESLAAYQQSGNLGDLKQISGMEKGETPFAKIDTKDYTPKSLSLFQKSGNYADLQPKQETIKATQNYEAAQQDVNGNWIFVPKVPGLPIKDISGNIVTNPQIKPKQEKAATESQAKAATFFSQMTSATNELNKLQQEGFDPSSTVSQAAVSLAGTPLRALAGPQAQRARQIQEQWTESFLRIKTGAAATKDEIRKNTETFFPRIGETDPSIIAQKERARAQAEQDVLRMTKEGGGNVAPTTKALSAQDQQALTWANANPTDQRAAQIKQRLGL